MLDVLRRAVADRQELPGSPIAIELDDVTVEIDRATASGGPDARPGHRPAAQRRPGDVPRHARQPARRAGRRAARARTWRTRPSSPSSSELGDLPEIEPAGAAQLSAELRHELRDDLRSDLGFHAAVEQLWPVLTPEQVLAELFASPDRLASAGGELDLSGLHRAEGSAWTVADAPLLDELAELLGPPPERPGRTSRSPTALRIGPTPRRC